MKKVEVTCGFKVYDDSGNLLRYQGDWGGEGYIYKDDDAFENHPDEVCYISERSFPDGQDFATVDEALRCGETRNTIRGEVRDAYGDDYLLTEEQVEYFAKDVYYLADWACISTYLTENFELDDLIEYDHDHNEGMFTQVQYEAVMNDMYPKEYVEKYGRDTEGGGTR